MGKLFAPGLFEGQSVCVTGGGTGIGLATAKELGTLGAKVALCGRRPEPLAEAQRALEALGIEVFAQPCDIRDPERVEHFVEAVESTLGALDVLVNNAGGQFPCPAQTLSSNGFEAVVRNNLLGTWNMTRSVAQRMIPRQRGRIINITAQVARGFPGMAHTGAARAGVDNLTKTLAVEWAQFGIRVNAVAPGVIRSSGTDQYPPALLKQAQAATPLKRLGSPAEVAQLVVYLASPWADYVTGQTFAIDGGQSLWGDMWPIDDDIPKHAPEG